MLTKTKLIEILQTCNIFKTEFLRASDVDPKFLSDPEVMLLAIKRDPNSIREASEELQADREFMLEAVKQDGRALRYASRELLGDKEIVLAAVKQDGWALMSSAMFCSDRDVVLAAVKQDGKVLRFASEELKNDPSVAFEAMKNDVYACRYVGKELVDEIVFSLDSWGNFMPTVWQEALEQHGWMERWGR